MEGHVKKRAKDTWSVVVDFGRDPASGKRRQLWRSVRGTKREAQQALAELIHQRDHGLDQPPTKITLGAVS